MADMDLIGSIQSRDPARPTTMEVIFGYPGFHIMTFFYPVAHWLWQREFRALARFWSNLGRVMTGVDIHPGAHIGRNLFIDHGTGVVIGETAIIGNDCTFYHGITLGGRGSKYTPGTRRHPVVGDNVVIGAAAQILGAITLGDRAQIGAGAVVTIDVPPGITAVGNPARLVGHLEEDACAYGLPEGQVPDPLREEVDALQAALHLKDSVNKTH